MESNVFRAIATFALISASAFTAATAGSSSAATLTSTAPWWERVTVTVASDGQPHSCKYETSFRPADSRNCEVVGDAGSAAAMAGTAESTAKDQYTRLTFERRFHPGLIEPADADVEPGDTLLGRQVMSLAIDAAGAVKGCRIVATSGAMTPSYGCADAAAEHFEASASKPGATQRQGFMTILVYGHAEHVV